MIAKFRYDINALRALAVIGVIAFHYKLTGFSGGFCGVDIFFVISGYLMSQNILNEIDNKNFSIFKFYARRFKRIVPALLFLVIIVTSFCFFVYFPNDFLVNESNATASLLFLSNIFYWKNSGYFDPASDTNIFLHTWSLSVEWQFYMIYPIILILFKKIKTKTSAFTNLFMVVTVLLCLASILYTPTHETSSFYMLPTRSWEMMFGGLAFMLEGKINRLKLKKIVNICGCIAIILSFVLVNTDMAWPGLFTLFPVCGTFLIILTNLNRSILVKHEIVQFVGKISYSLYLWHWPIYVASNYLGIEKNNLSIIILILISFFFAIISFKFIESNNMRSVKVVIFTMTFTLICTLTLSYFNLNARIFDANILSIVNYPQDHKMDIKKQFSGRGCFLSSEDKGIQDFNAVGCLGFKDGEKNILLLGDSHAADIAESIREKLRDRGINLIEATASGCLPIVNPKGEKRCTVLIDYVFKDFVLKNKSKIDGVILSANWLLADKLNQKDIIKDIHNTINYLNKNKIPTIILGQNEIYTIPYVNIAAKNVEYKRDNTQNFIDRKSLKINDLLQKKFFQRYVNIYDLPSIPMLSPHNEPYMFDQNHYTKYGADLITNRILVDSITIKFLKTPKL